MTPRTARYAPGSLVYHILNRAAARLPLFTTDDTAFLLVPDEAH